MDVRCGKCGEPWEVYWLNNDINDEYVDDSSAPDDPCSYVKSGKGCPVCDWGKNTDVSRGRMNDEEELQADRIKDIMENTDEDPMKYF